MSEQAIKLTNTIPSIKSELFILYKELHALEFLEKAGLTFGGAVTDYKSQLIVDIDSLINDFLIMNGELPRIEDQSVMTLCFYDLDSKDEDLSDCERQCKQLYLDSKKVIHEKWKSVI